MLIATLEGHAKLEPKTLLFEADNKKTERSE
jgi:hypothetical protein